MVQAAEVGQVVDPGHKTDAEEINDRKFAVHFMERAVAGSASVLMIHVPVACARGKAQSRNRAEVEERSTRIEKENAQK